MKWWMRFPGAALLGRLASESRPDWMPTWLLPLLLPTFMLFATVGTLSVAGPPEAMQYTSEVRTTETEASRPFNDTPARWSTLSSREFKARARWVVSVVALWTAMAVALATSVKAVWACTVDGGEPESRLRTSFLLSAFLGLLLAFYFSWCDSLDGLSINWIQLEWSWRQEQAAGVVWYFHVVNSCAGATLVALSVATALVARDVMRASANELRGLLMRMRWLMYVAGLALVTGVFEIFSINSLYVACAHESGVAPGVFGIDDLRGVAGSVTMALGSGFTLYMLCTFVPAVWIIRLAIDQHAYNSASSEARGEWIQSMGLQISPWSTASGAIALVGPALVAMAANADGVVRLLDYIGGS